ncbi:MAG: gamma-glutamyl-gamma-aminobutyrate hydrolase family protein [Vicinamibacterales bacterium]
MPPRIAIALCRKMPDYVESVRLAGGDPWELHHASDPAEAVVQSCAGLLLTGGADVAPERYGEERHSTVTDVDAARDEYEIALVRSALAADLPVLAICRGLQVMNVAAGGSLMQDIPSGLGTQVPHQVPSPKDAIAHDVSLGSGSRLAGLMGHAAAGGRLRVNSRHHQSVRRLAAGFVITAEAPDGVIEAIELPPLRFCIGVQWHPENFVESGVFLPLFAGLIAAARI